MGGDKPDRSTVPPCGNFNKFGVFLSIPVNSTRFIMVVYEKIYFKSIHK